MLPHQPSLKLDEVYTIDQVTSRINMRKMLELNCDLAISLLKTTRMREEGKMVCVLCISLCKKNVILTHL